MPRAFLTTKDVAAQLQVSDAAVRQWHEKGLLVPVRVLPGGERHYTQDSVDAFAAERGWPAPLVDEAQAQ